MMRDRLLSVLAGIAAMGIPAAVSAQHYTIGASCVAETVSRAGLQVSPDQIAMPAGVVASTANPALKVRSIEKLGDQRIAARIECVNSRQCLPFFAEIRLRRGSDGEGVSNGEEIALLRSITGSENHPVVVRSGAKVTLLLESTHVHISIQAICLESGVQGQTIRVTDKSHKLFYSAQVLDASLVKGQLQ